MNWMTTTIAEWAAIDANRWSALTLADRWVAICVEAGQTFVAGAWAGQIFV